MKVELSTSRSRGTGLQTAGLTDDQIGLVKRQILKPRNRTATDDELALFLGQCERTGLDPFARQIYGVFRKSGGEEKMSVQVSIDGLRLVAERSGRYLGQRGPFWCAPDGAWRETWFDREAPRAAKVVVQKLIAGQIAETPAIAHFDEYVVTDYNGKLTGLWPSKPALMLAKCAEALALRKAFPQELSGIYTVDELPVDGPTVPESVALSAPPVMEPERLDDASFAELCQAVEAANPDNQVLRSQLIAVGLQDVPATVIRVGSDGEVQVSTALRKLSAVQAVELCRWLPEKGENR